MERTWRLNERHYGGLTGLNKAETAAKHGEEQVKDMDKEISERTVFTNLITQVKIWRRSFDVPPPAMGADHEFYDVIRSEAR